MDPLQTAAELARRYLDGVGERRVNAQPASLTTEIPDGPSDPAAVVRAIHDELEPALVATAGPRYFGFVTGGSLPAAVGADWLSAAYDQNVCLQVMSPGMAEVEQITAGWLLDLLGLPETASTGFVTGGQMANFTGLAAGRHRVLARAGHDVERDGLIGAPPVRVVAGEQVHVSALAALRYLGLGSQPDRVPTDDQGRMRADRLELDDRPTLLLVQAGEVNTGAFDPIGEIAARRGANTWIHVDGAFGLWAAASPARRHLLDGHHLADSWATDGHKWLNVPYDSGFAFVNDREAHEAALGASAAYLQAAPDERQGFLYAPESSRRARALPAYAAIRQLGRSGIAELVDRCCELATRFADGLRPHVEVLNEVVLNQVLVAVPPEAIARIQQDGTAWFGGTTFRGRQAMRISVSNWRTTEGDVDRAIGAILSSL